MQGSSHVGQQPSIDAIGLGEHTGGLGETPGTFRDNIDAGPVGERLSQHAMVAASCLEGDPLNRISLRSSDQRVVAFGCVGELVLGADRVNLEVENRCGDVDADCLC